MSLHYIDLRVDPQNDQTPSGTSIMVLARCLAITHGLRQQHGLPLLIAMPMMKTGERPHPGKILRLFADRDALEQGADLLEATEVVKSYVIVGRIRAVPDDYNGNWTEYRRYRIPGRSSRLTESRARRLEAGNALPYFRLNSASTGQAFSLRVQPIEHAHAISNALPEPDSFGLSVPTRPFALPNLPVL